MERLRNIRSQLPQLQTSFSPPLKTFHKFPELVKELRLKIWGYAAMSEPRYVHLDVLGHKPKDERNHETTTPSLLRPTSESRTESMRYYSACKLRSMVPERYEGRIQHVIYVNFAIDTFWYNAACYSPDFPVYVDLQLQQKTLELWRFSFEREDLSRIQRLHCVKPGFCNMSDSTPVSYWSAPSVANVAQLLPLGGLQEFSVKIYDVCTEILGPTVIDDKL